MSAYWLGNKEHLKFVFGEHLGFFKYIFVNILLRSSGPFALRDVYSVLLGAQLRPSLLTQLLSTPLLPLYSTALFFYQDILWEELQQYEPCLKINDLKEVWP